jgi:anti-sigma regulatory factor (Ser/Thr protein kinase)
MTGSLVSVDVFCVEADVRGGPQAAARARRLMREELNGRVPEAVLGDAALLLTELVANGVRHGGADADSALHVLIEGRPAGLHVEVVNPDHQPGAVGKRPPDLEGGGGLGLHIVEHVASRWGVRERPRTAVWFELDCL